MALAILTAIDAIAERLDEIRSQILRVTMSFPKVRPIFQTRSIRLAVLFTLSTAISLVLAIHFPLWVLAIGPLVYGVPHLASSLRFFHYSLRSKPEGLKNGMKDPSFVPFFRLVIPLWGLVATYRLFTTLTPNSMPLSEWAGSNWIEISALLLTFLAAATLYRRQSSFVLIRLLCLLPMIHFSWSYPAATIGAFVLIHNFVGFFYWIASASNRAEKQVGMAALAVTFMIHGAIILRIFDEFSLLGNLAEHIDFAAIHYRDIGKMIAPWSSDERFWFHAVQAYAFGQSIHYFIWLKAIPDQHHYHEIPTSFRQSVRLLQNDFGMKCLLWIIYLTLGGFVIWLIKGIVLARIFYFSLATFHGYLEIAGLALMLSKKFKTRPSPI